MWNKNPNFPNSPRVSPGGCRTLYLPLQSIKSLRHPFSLVLALAPPTEQSRRDDSKKEEQWERRLTWQRWTQMSRAVVPVLSTFLTRLFLGQDFGYVPLCLTFPGSFWFSEFGSTAFQMILRVWDLAMISNLNSSTSCWWPCVFDVTSLSLRSFLCK